MSPIFTRPLPAALFWVTYVAFVLLDAGLVTKALRGTAASPRVGTDSSPVFRRSGLLWLMVGEGVALVLATVATFQLPWTIGPLAVGLGLAWAGIALRFGAKQTLGRFFVAPVVVQDGHRVVTTGPYAVIRHPGYAGSVLALLGFGIASANVASVVVFIAVVALVFVKRIGPEERVLRSELGDFVEYSRRTSRLVPRVW